MRFCVTLQYSTNQGKMPEWSLKQVKNNYEVKNNCEKASAFSVGLSSSFGKSSVLFVTSLTSKGTHPRVNTRQAETHKLIS